ncbi:MAG TPA: translocation/assembly module TamB domain-containing protein [Bacteroidota bacterium]|nr:translocation/assembly module TamB domain-containing protein [Bacteroidota bacterium]
MKKLRTIALYLLIGIPVLVGVLVAITQTQTFRNRLRAAALAELDSVVNGTVSIGTLQGDLITGFTLDSVAIDVAGGPFLRIPRLEIAYNIFALPAKRISIRRLTLSHPAITLYRPRGGEWNLAEFLREAPRDTTASHPFTWSIDVERFEILDGTVALLDSASLADEEHPAVVAGPVEYHAFTLRELYLVMAANIRQETQRAVIASCSFSSASPDFRLRMLCGVFTVSPTEARVDSMRIITAKTNLAIDAALRDIDVRRGLSLRTLQWAPVELSLRARPVDIRELRMFLPPLDFLDGAPEITLQASGTFGDVAVKRLDVRFGRSSLALKGGITNLHDPRRLAMNVKITESTAEATDVQALLPGLDLPDLSPLGTSTLNVEYEGTPLDFRTKFLVETALGSVQSSGLRLTIGGPATLAYDGEVGFRKLDLARALDDDGLRSSLNGTVIFSGSGVNARRLESTFGLAIDSSSFRGLPLTATRATIHGSEGTISGRVDVSLGDMRARLGGELVQSQGSPPAFHVEGNVSSLNLEDIFHDTSDNSDITMKLDARGSGLSWSTVNGEATLDLSSSRFRDYTLDEGAFHVVLDQKDTLQKRLEFRSNIADLTLTGAFDLKYLLNLASFEAASVKGAIVDRIALIDPSLASGFDRGVIAARSRTLAALPRRIDAKYEIRLKDLEPLSAAAGTKSFDGTGLLTGSIRGGYADLALSCDMTLDDFFYGRADAGVLVEDGKVRLDVSSLTPDAPLEGAVVRLQAAAGRVHINRNTLDSLDIGLSYGRERASYAASTIVNGDYRLGSTGSARVDESSVTVTPATLDVAYKDYMWRADPGASFRVNHVGAELTGLVFRRDSQEVALNGSLGQGRSFDAAVTGKNIDLEGLKHLIGGAEAPGEPKAFTGNAQVTLKGSGTLADPVMTATVDADSVTFRSLPFGRLSADLKYRDRVVEGHVRLVEPGKPADAPPVMTVDGTLPLDLRMEKTGEDTAEPPMNLRVLSHGVQMSILEPLLHTFKELTGVMSCDLTLSGTLSDPAYAGTLGISKCSFIFLPNNIRYTLDGTFAPEGERIRVVDCVIRNVPEDVRAGREGVVHLGGDFSLRNLRPGDFNLTADGRLLVVKETTEKSSLAVYGDLFVEIGPGPLHFTGEIESSLLKGSVSIRNSSLIFPPTQAQVAEESPQSVRLLFVDDTLKAEKKPERALIAKYFAEPSDTAAARAAERIRSKSFMDGLRYDLNIGASGGNTEIRMIFNPITNEELVAALDGKFTITGDGRIWTGDLTIARAYYNFFKRFDATGSIRYTGDFLNPEMNIVATYQGTRALDTSATGAPGASEKVVVTVKITGTRKAPKVDFAMTINDIDYMNYTGPKSNDIQSDAIAFIVAGNFPMSQRTSLPGQVQSTASNSLLSGASSVLTGRLTELLRAQGLDMNVDLNVAGKEATELRLSGTVLNGYLHFGGTILNDPLANANISILYSLGTIFDAPTLQNLMLELERRVEPGTLGNANDLRRINSARVYYRFSF